MIETKAKCPQKLDKCDAFEHVTGPGALMSLMISRSALHLQREDERVDDVELAQHFIKSHFPQVHQHDVLHVLE